jgi:hypothetical protein
MGNSYELENTWIYVMGNSYALEKPWIYLKGNSHALEETWTYLMGNSDALEKTSLLYMSECLSLDIPTERTYESISQNLRRESVCYVCDCYGGLCVSMCQVHYLLC